MGIRLKTAALTLTPKYSGGALPFCHASVSLKSVYSSVTPEERWRRDMTKAL